MLFSMFQLTGGVILGVALWLRHDPKTSNLLELEFEGTHPPSTFYISMMWSFLQWYHKNFLCSCEQILQRTLQQTRSHYSETFCHRFLTCDKIQ